MVQNLWALMPDVFVTGFPWRRAEEIRYRIPLEILKFEAVEGKEVTLLVHWQLFDRVEKTTLANRRSHLVVPILDGKQAGAVRAKSQALAKLSEEISATVQPMLKKSAHQ